MPRRTWSLRLLIGGIYFCIMAVILGTLALYFSHRTTEDYMRTVIATRSGQASFAADMLAPYVTDYLAKEKALQALNGADAASAVKRAALQQDGERLIRIIKITLRSIYRRAAVTEQASPRRVTILHLNGQVLAETPPFASINEPQTPRGEVQQVLDPLGTGVGVEIRRNDDSAEDILYIAAPIKKPVTSSAPALLGPTNESKHEDNPTLTDLRGILVLAVPVSEVPAAITHIKNAIALAFLGGILILLFLNAGISSKITRPLGTLSAIAERFAQGHLHERVLVTGTTEIASLGTSLNRMATELRQTITRLAQERAQAQAILASMVDGVLVTDTRGTILLMNHSAEQICAVRETDVRGKILPDTPLPSALHDLLLNTLENGLPLLHEVIFTHTEPRVLEAHLAPITVDGDPLGVVIVLYDVTDQRKIEQVRRDFVANVSHELRTPVASIRAMAETLYETQADDPALLSSFLQTIIHESERLSKLLDDLLHLSRIESGRQVLAAEPVDLCMIIRRVAQWQGAQFAAKQQHLTLDIPDALLLLGDHDAFVQIVVNLLDNARKYTPAGGIITVELDEDEMVRLRVADNGIGIPPEDLDRVFERFYRVDKARSREEGGSGLGLAIVHHLVELQGGCIFARSAVGEGTTFSVVFPLERKVEAGELPTAVEAPDAGV